FEITTNVEKHLFQDVFLQLYAFLLLPNLTTRSTFVQLRVTTQSKALPCFEFDLTILNLFSYSPKDRKLIC
ncbi:MAG: hypothetical protein II998_05430, partial [Clostridia bacterium]|nr:hypothetical protein [Clostridia bacterium]